MAVWMNQATEQRVKARVSPRATGVRATPVAIEITPRGSAEPVGTLYLAAEQARRVARDIVARAAAVSEEGGRGDE